MAGQICNDGSKFWLVTQEGLGHKYSEHVQLRNGE
jgi:hypothetical protein